MRGDESFSGQVGDPVTDLVMTRHDRADPLTAKVMAYRKGGVAAAAVMREVWWL